MMFYAAFRRTLSYLHKYPDPRLGHPFLSMPIIALLVGLSFGSLALVLLLLAGLFFSYTGWGAAETFLRDSGDFIIAGVVSLAAFFVGFGFGVSGLRYHLARPLVIAQQLYEHIPDDIGEFRRTHQSPRSMSAEQRTLVEDLEDAVQPLVWQHVEEIRRTLPRMKVHELHQCVRCINNAATYRSADGVFYCFLCDPRRDWPVNLHIDQENNPDVIPHR